MLPSSQRLSSRQFDLVMKKGRIIRSPIFLIRLLKVEEKSRVSAVVPKKVCKTAVGRNKIRRQMYEAVQPFFSSLVQGYHIALFANDKAKEIDFADLSKEVKDLFVKAGLLG
jgi:ribonuclease P protein component